ncbi:heterokaryon incompatibility protein-domain-containing protein [Xylariaceae sp. FL0255]|nr:heterokaryon incompatibility protein-domain-containing protein [Xylariaceae sp. FL0255]
MTTIISKLPVILGLRRSPSIPIGHQGNLELLRSWLQNCDRKHSCTSRHLHQKSKGPYLPTRVINVNPSGDAEDLRLDTPSKTDRSRYLALSHCWGQSDIDKNPPWRTLRANIESRRKGFKLSDLLKTFKDAVYVTRELGIPYLWIDSICIIQGQDGDWEAESRKMDQVFTSAYCTIAATSAPDARAGFWKAPVENESFYVRGATKRCFYVTTNVADFDKDVASAGLNQRAWVMQERFLSSRTIHFTDTQIYGECGEGVYAGDKIFLRSKYRTTKSFEVDAQFPSRLQSSGIIATWKFVQSMLGNYSGRGLTELSDKAIAISGLMARVSEALHCPIHFGIIEWYLHRTLLWKRSSKQKTGRIDYNPQRYVPSWSWMSYGGAIEFPRIDFSSLDVLKGLSFNDRYVTTMIWRVANSGMGFVKAGNDDLPYQLQNSSGLNGGWLQLDDEREDNALSPVPYVAVLAKYNRRPADCLDYLVIFVRPRASQSGYSRLGMGGLHRTCTLEEVGRGDIF